MQEPRNESEVVEEPQAEVASFDAKSSTLKLYWRKLDGTPKCWLGVNTEDTLRVSLKRSEGKGKRWEWLVGFRGEPEKAGHGPASTKSHAKKRAEEHILKQCLSEAE